MNYYKNLNQEIKEYFKILSNEFPEWLNEYIETPEMERIGKISMDCGCDYTDLFPNHEWYSNLDHSVGVALIIWNFTKDKKQTLSGLFHDIATPAFKHCIDFMNGDSEKQESTEEKTTQIIENSKEIMNLLKRDNIRLEEVDDYKLYPIADNNTPNIAADRLEYNFSSGFIFHGLWNLEDLKECYEDLVILKNENGEDELGFKHIKIAEKYILVVSKLWPWWIIEEDRTSMQFWADICMSMSHINELTIDDLYRLSEKEIINKIENSSNTYIKEAFAKFRKCTKCYKSQDKVEGKYCVNVKGKRRYINPLIHDGENYGRGYDISKICKEKIDEYFKIPIEGYTYLDFEFKPIK